MGNSNKSLVLCVVAHAAICITMGACALISAGLWV